MWRPESRAGDPCSAWAGGPRPSKKPSQLPDTEESHLLLPGLPTCKMSRGGLSCKRGTILQGPLLPCRPGAGARDESTSLPHTAGRSAPGSSAPVTCMLLPIRTMIPRGRKGPLVLTLHHFRLVCIRSETQRGRAPLLRSHRTNSSICHGEDNELPDGGSSFHSRFLGATC